MTQRANANAKSKNTNAKRASTPAAKPTIKNAMKEVETGATHLAQAVKAEVKNRAGEAIDQLKENVDRAEQKAEKLIEKIPGVGPDAAEKLREASGDAQRSPDQSRSSR